LEDILHLGISLFVVAAYGDVKTLQIPNALVLAIAVLGALRLIVIADPTVTLYTVSASVVVFIVAFLLFWRGLVGGGDAKLITAATLLIGYHDLFHFLLVMSLCGGLVSLVVLVTRRSGQLAVPYGVAIAGGAIATLFFQPSLFG
jgi:prepilin peptidase CpaA